MQVFLIEDQIILSGHCIHCIFKNTFSFRYIHPLKWIGKFSDRNIISFQDLYCRERKRKREREGERRKIDRKENERKRMQRFQNIKLNTYFWIFGYGIIII